MDTAFLQAMIKEQGNGNRSDDTFTPQGYTNTGEELSKAFGMDIKKDHLKNRLKTLKEHFSKFFDVFNGNSLSGFSWDPITKLLGADEEVWDKLIKESWSCKMEGKTNSSLPRDMLELFATDRATSARAETAKKRKNTRMKENEHTPEMIDEIDELLETNDIFLENLASANDIHVVSDTPNSQATIPSFSKSKKRKFEDTYEFN